MAHLSLLAVRILGEPCRLSTNGDSRIADLGSNQLPTAWHKSLQPIRWSGWGGSGLENGFSRSGGIFEFGRAGTWAQAGWTTNPSGGAGDVARWPCYFGDCTFAGDLAADDILVTPYSIIANMAEFSGGDWMQNAVTCRAIFYRSTGSTVGIDKIGTQTRRVPTTATGTYAGSNSLANGYNSIDTTLAALAERGDLRINGANPNIVETGKNLYFLGWRFWRDELGLQISFAGVAGALTGEHNLTARVSDAAIAAYVAAYNINTCLFMSGHNDVNIDATWQSDYAAWIERWRAAVTANGGTFRGLILSDYQTTANTAARVDAMESRLTTIANAANDVALIRLGSIDAGYALNNGLLSDDVHTTADGALYFAGLVQRELASSISSSCRTNRVTRRRLYR